MSLDTLFNPVFRLTLKMENFGLAFDRDEESIVEDTVKLIDNIITSCNVFTRPEFTKLEYISQEEFIL
jgi:hypothetical protein